MTVKLSTALYDATISGDTVEADKIRSEINDRIRASSPKSNEAIIDFNTILNDDRSSAKSIYDFLNRHLGEDWWEWETETIEHMLWIKFAVALEGINRDKIFAIRHLCNSDRAFFDWYEFNQIALSFAGVMADFECLRTPSIGMAINAVKSMNYIRPDREEKFGSDAIRYITILIINEGVCVPPPSIAPLIGSYMEGKVSEEMKNSWPKIMERFSELVNNKNMIIEENTIDIQAKRLLIAEMSAISYGG